MKALIQRVSQAHVQVEGQKIGQIKTGLLVFLGLEKEDDIEKAKKLFEKVLKYRVFKDQDGKMNLNVKEIGGEVLLVSQFTLAASTTKGLRPSFSEALAPVESKKLYLNICEWLNNTYPKVAFGQFGADMQVQLTNDGPVTFLLEV